MLESLESLIARKLFGSSQVPLLVNLDIYLKSKKRSLRFSGIKKKGYCSGITSIWLYSKWLQTQPKTYYLPSDDPRGKRDKVTIQDEAWLRSVENFITTDWQTLKGNGSLDELGELTQLSKEEVIVKLDELKGMVDFKKMVTNKEQLRSFLLLGRYIDSGRLKTPVSFDSLEMVLRDDNDWFNATVKLVTSWDGRRKLTKEEEGEFERFIYQIEYFQHFKKHVPKEDLKKSGVSKSPLEFLEDTKARAMKKEDSSFYLDSGKSGKQVDLAQLKAELKKEGVVKEGELIYIASSNPGFGHATALFKEGGKYYYFDSLQKSGEVEAATLDEVAELIMQYNTYPFFKPHAFTMDIFSIDKSGWNQITRTIAYGSVQSIKSLLVEKGIDLNKQDENGNTPLTLAIERYRLEVVRLLLDENADPNVPNKAGDTPVMVSAGYDYRDVVALLLDRNADPNIPNRSGYTPLMMAAKYGYCDVVKLLLAKGADPNKYDKNGYSVLTIAARNGQLEAMKLLLDKNIKSKLVDKRGRHPIIEAAEKGHVDVVAYLLREQNVDSNVKDERKQTPLVVAAGFNHPEVLDLLLKEGADIEMVGADKKSSFVLAADFGCLDSLQYLIKEKPDLINKVNGLGWTPLTAAVNGGRLEAVKLLLENGGDPNMANEVGKIGKTPFVLAVEKGNLDIIFAFLKKDIGLLKKINRRQIDALYKKAIKKKHVNLQKILLPYKGLEALVGDMFYRDSSKSPKRKRRISLLSKKKSKKQEELLKK